MQRRRKILTNKRLTKTGKEILVSYSLYRDKKSKETYRDKRKAALEKLETILDTIFYQIIPFSTRIEEFARSPIGSPSVISPVLGYDTNLTKSSVSSLHISEKLEIDLCEIMNALYDEQTNVLSSMDPTTQLEGSALFYKGYLVQNQLEKPYLESVLRVALMYNLLEHDNSRAEKGIVEVVQINKKGNLYQKLDLPHTLLEDNEHFENKIKKSGEIFSKFL